MDISLPDSQKAFINQQVKAGGYRSPDDWVAHVVKTMEEEARELEQAIDKGIASCDAGRKRPFDDACVADMQEKLQRRLAAAKR